MLLVSEFWFALVKLLQHVGRKTRSLLSWVKCAFRNLRAPKNMGFLRQFLLGTDEL